MEGPQKRGKKRGGWKKRQNGATRGSSRKKSTKGGGKKKNGPKVQLGMKLKKQTRTTLIKGRRPQGRGFLTFKKRWEKRGHNGRVQKQMLQDRVEKLTEGRSGLFTAEL